MATAGSQVLIGRTATGYRVSVGGRGTMWESQALSAFLDEALKDSECQVVIDLQECSYLDSTFLGSLVGLHKRCSARGAYAVVAAADQLDRLFGNSQIDKILRFVGTPPAFIAPPTPVPPAVLDGPELGAFILQCHRLLGELDGPDASAFAAVADALARELGASGKKA